MINFFKRFGLGLIYILCSPFILAFLCIWGLNNIVIFVIELFRAFKSFFKGRSFFVEFDEDIEAKKILSIEAINGSQNASMQPIISANSPYVAPTIDTNANINDMRPTLSRPTLDDEEHRK